MGQATNIATVVFAGTDTGTDGTGEVLTTTITDANGTNTFTTSFADDAVSTGSTGTLSTTTVVIAGTTYTLTANAGQVSISSSDTALAFSASTTNTSAAGDTGSSGAEISAATVNNVITTGAGTGSWTVGVDTASVFDERVLYKATLTVNFAGFEQEVTVNTTAANNFIATQTDINDAIKNAIDSNPELSKLLSYKDGTGLQSLTITSNVEGLNDFAIDLNQGQLAATATAGFTTFNASDLSAMQAGLVETTANDSAATDTVSEVIALVNGLGTNLDNTGASSTAYSFNASGSSTNGTDETNVTNVSVIDMGTGTNDLVVLNSHDDSANTLDFTAAWGKVSVVNFFDDLAASTIDTTAQGANLTEGDHIIDFTHWLNDQTSSSGSALSATAIATTDNVVSASADLTLASNEVVIINDWTGNATDTFANMTAADIDAALTAGTAFGNMNTASSATATGATLVGTTQSSIIMIENDENAGEYNVFSVETTDAGGTESYEVTAIGSIDFGAQIDANAVFA